MRLFRKYCESGRGAVFLVSACGGLANYETFFGSYSNSIIFMGVPFNSKSGEIAAKLSFLEMKEHYKL